MSRLPLITAVDFERILFLMGFAKIRQRGSHAFYRHPDGRTTTLPHHPGRVLARPLMREILREIDLPPAEYLELLKKR